MSRNTEHQFISTDTEEVKATVVALWERFANTKLHAADPMMLLSMWVADLFVRARADINFTGNQNLPSAADGENLDALADLYYLVDRPDATPATCTVRFYITEAQSTPKWASTRFSPVTNTRSDAMLTTTKSSRGSTFSAGMP